MSVVRLQSFRTRLSGLWIGPHNDHFDSVEGKLPYVLILQSGEPDYCRWFKVLEEAV